MVHPSPSRSSTPAAPASKASADAHSARSGSISTRTHSNGRLAGIALLLLLAPGCYYAHLAEGQLRLLRAERPIDEVLADPATPDEVRTSLVLVADVLDFAAALGLQVDGQYTDYAAWPGDRVVTALVATESHHIEAAGFWFPVIGRMPYKGFFDPVRAEREAARLRARGLETCLVPVPAYSTLGWLDDPVTQPMLRRGAGAFVETLLHELVHATAFVSGDADWNEGVATFVGEEASLRFFARRGVAEAARERARIDDERAVGRVVGALRDRIAALYETPAADATPLERARLEDEARAALRALPLATADPARVAERTPLADPCLALRGTYERDLPLWQARLDALGGDLARFVAEAREASQAEDPRATLAGPATAAP
jgi:predicted aminopeptidase